MQILTIAGYKFIELDALYDLRLQLLELCSSLCLKGTILLSSEGINIGMAGKIESIVSFKTFLQTDARFADIRFHETYYSNQPFQRLKIKLKKEIITLRKSEINPVTERAPSISPQEFKQWLDEKRDIISLDTRNDYEVRFGTFANATNLHLANFGDLPNAVTAIDKNKTIVMFCTGGIRCEKAALYMLQQGYTDVYQLDGGILGSLAKVGGAHYEGECFVFDERIAVDAKLTSTGTVQCAKCAGPITKVEQQLPAYAREKLCTACA